jgi:thioesterase domain-containing protein
VFTAILEVLGVNTSALPGDQLSFAQFSALARATNTVLGNIEEDAFDKIMRLLQRNIAVAARYRHARVATNVLVFAAADEPERILNEHMWPPYVDGDVTFHAVAGTHSTMLSSQTLQQIAPIIDEHLRRRMLDPSRPDPSE